MAADRRAADAALGHAFMRRQPAAAARVVEALAAEVAAGLFDRVPARIGAPVLAAMLPLAAARVLQALPDPAALALLGAMPAGSAAGVLRHVPAHRRRALLTGLPTATAMTTTLVMGYAEDSVAAWTDPEVVALPAETPAGEAVAHLQSSNSPHPTVMVVDAQHRLAGSLDLLGLMRAPAEARLGTLARRDPPTLAALTPLAAALAHPAWDEQAVLPVVERGERLLGLLTRARLHEASTRLGGAGTVAPADGSLAGAAAQLGWGFVAGTVSAVLALLPPVPRVSPVAAAPDAGSSRHDER